MLETRDALLARLIAETNTPEEWKEHEAYCDYVHATLGWLETGCCDTDEIEDDSACEELRVDSVVADDEWCG